MTNTLIAIKNIVDSQGGIASTAGVSVNRMNSQGEGLEMYVKDSFCGTINVLDRIEKDRIFAEKFSYIGNQNNPPDVMIKEGDAIEVKKLNAVNSMLALNSSYPKDRLYSDSPMITRGCRECEQWSEKDMLYVVGTVAKDTVKSLWFVYGDCYAAEREVYERIKSKFISGLREIPDIELAETNELGRVNRVDPLGITNLRIRGMWGIENPNKVFGDIVQKNTGDFILNVLMKKEKWESFPKSNREALISMIDSNFSITDTTIPSPNNPAKMMEVVYISYNR